MTYYASAMPTPQPGQVYLTTYSPLGAQRVAAPLRPGVALEPGDYLHLPGGVTVFVAWHETGWVQSAIRGQEDLEETQGD